MTRKECYDYIVKNNLKEEVKRKFNAPYSSVPTTLLEDFIGIINSCAAATNVEAYSRNECFDVIRSNSWQEEIKAKYGKPYNSVSTDKLQEFLASKFNGPVNNCEEQDTVCHGYVDDKARKVLKGLCMALNMQDLLKNLD